MEVEQNNVQSRVAEGYMAAKMLHKAEERVGSGGSVVGAVVEPAQIAARSMEWVEATLQAPEVANRLGGGGAAVKAAMEEGYLMNENTNTIATAGGGEVEVVSISFKNRPLANAFLMACKV